MKKIVIIIVIIILITIVIMIVIIEKDCGQINSVVIITTEVIRSVLNSFFFLRWDFTSTKKHKKNTTHQKVPKAPKSIRKV